jgi:hypothetical protein
MEIDGDDQAAGDDAQAHRGRKIDETDGTGHEQQKPVGMRNDFENPLLVFHAISFDG